MKTLHNTIFIVMMLSLLGIGKDATAQGKGKGHKENNGHGNAQPDHGRDSRWDFKERNHTRYDAYHRHEDHDRSRTHIYRQYRAPRYVYYRDYNVYFDCDRQEYISLNGRNWSTSARIPVAMRGVNMRVVTALPVDYYHDNFHMVLQRRRPAYVEIHAGW